MVWVSSTREWGCIAKEGQTYASVFDFIRHHQCASGRAVSLTEVEPIIASSSSQCVQRQRGHRTYMPEECRLHAIDIEFQAPLYPAGRGQRPLGPIWLLVKPWINSHRNGIPGWCPQLSNKADMLHGHRPSWSLACRIEASHRTQSPRRKPLNVDVRLPSPMIYRLAKCRLKLPRSRCCSQLSHFAC
ncbi:hypothetical protein DAEQUDRAFT_372852 [Daedalea quercina L-15889]|uniref:Uncharacterized protein n=1 Tax=Daedalea quercina L-15889 TaxID=1314783 RepID=A0A165P6C8_9APHY|nr:hypothetical protein DAEQUDRAFT_372852 [Daedalea quercina L-15889]